MKSKALPPTATLNFTNVGGDEIDIISQILSNYPDWSLKYGRVYWSKECQGHVMSGRLYASRLAIDAIRNQLPGFCADESEQDLKNAYQREYQRKYRQKDPEAYKWYSREYQSRRRKNESPEEREKRLAYKREQMRKQRLRTAAARKDLDKLGRDNEGIRSANSN